MSAGVAGPAWSVLHPTCGPGISQERYTCPSLALHPREPVFLAQTNGNYLALFSAVWPYRMSRRRRYEGHKVPLPCPFRGELSTGPRAPHQTVPAVDVGPQSARTLCAADSVFCFPGDGMLVAWCPLKALGPMWPCPRPRLLGREGLR